MTINALDSKSVKISAILLGLAILLLCALVSGYYYGWSQLGRFNGRVSIVSSANYVTSLDSLIIFCPHSDGLLYNIEADIDATIVQYVTSQDGGSHGINQIWMNKLTDDRIRALAQNVADYRKRNPLDKATNQKYRMIVDSLANTILDV